MVELEKKVQENYTIHINKNQLDWIGANRGDTIMVKDDEGKHGRFISIWKKNK